MTDKTESSTKEIERLIADLIKMHADKAFVEGFKRGRMELMDRVEK